MQTKPLSAAFFDVDGTLLRGNIVQHYLDLAIQNRPYLCQIWIILSFVLRIPMYLLLDSINRSIFNQVFYSNYCHFTVDKCQKWSQKYFKKKLRYTIFSAAKERVDWHQKRGDQVVFVTGSLDFIVAPLAEFLAVSHIIATRLQVEQGFYTGEILGQPLSGSEKAKAIKQFCVQEKIDLRQSYAYGDSKADLKMLEIVGYPFVINPSFSLNRIAKMKNWPIEKWNMK
jgi:HAD superfamily hydrolase (TIGR01490 family)